MSSLHVRCLVGFAAILGLAGKVYSQTESGQQPGCHNPGDLVFVLDESGSIWGPDFQHQLDFVGLVADTFRVGPGQTHIGVETFGNDVRVIFHLNEYENSNDIKNAIRGIVQQRGGTRTDIALATMRQTMMSPHRRHAGATPVAIVITDGESEYPDLTEHEARLAQQQGIQMLAIGVGRSVVLEELNKIASSPDLVFRADNYAALDKLRNKLAWKACAVLTTTTTTTTLPPPPMMIEGCSGYRPLDVVWSVPSQAGPDDTQTALELVLGLSQELEIGPNRVQVALTPRLCPDEHSAAIRLKDHDTVEGFEQALAERRLDQTTSFDQQLEYIRTQGFSALNGGRSEAAKLAVLLIDNLPTGPDRTKLEATRVKRAGIKLVVIGVGDRVSDDYIKQLASSDKDAFHVDSYSDLAALQPTLVHRFCAGIMGTSRRELIDSLLGWRD